MPKEKQIKDAKGKTNLVGNIQSLVNVILDEVLKKKHKSKEEQSH